ncbi:linear gramicidin synthetase subunit D domain protein [Mycobacterium xenopi 4042]|uniref:Linear gramicidin synthetase subunit D domain protein n=1 Tax=Mycobacterium xenopi 4042 TaxID=1299334 RepID=X8CLB7_MYCXE|nr:linear gramicidin synthetase subunit D domain protein [Mycobacterium xenopi 4042]
MEQAAVIAAKTARRQAPRRLHHRHRRPGRGSPKAGAAVAEYMIPAAVVAIEALPLTRTANSTLAPCRHPNTVTSTGTGLRPLPPRRSWPASTPRCSGLSASASTTPSSILVETAFCRCRSWRGRVLRACCCGHATYSSSRPWPGWRGRPGRRQRRWRCRRGHRATARDPIMRWLQSIGGAVEQFNQTVLLQAPAGQRRPTWRCCCRRCWIGMPCCGHVSTTTVRAAGWSRCPTPVQWTPAPA